MAGIVELENIGISYSGTKSASPTPVLQGVSLSVQRGEFIVVFGVSGVGKSTLLRVVCGLLAPSEGSVRTLAESSEQTRPFGFVFQEPRLFPWRRVLANVMLGLEGLDISKDEAEERARSALELVELGDFADRFPRRLSGGQRQRVGIARALAVNPDLLLMDEPFGSLDAVTRKNLQNELMRIWRRTGSSVLFVTHDVEEAVFLADRVVLLAGSPAGIVEEYRIDADRPRKLEEAAMQETVRRIREDLQGYQHAPVI